MSPAPLRVAIDARELLGRPTGVGRYLAELLARWTRDPRLRGHQLHLYTPAPLPAGPWAGHDGASLVLHTRPGAGGTVWEQTTLAGSLRRDAPSVVFAPAYSAPLACRAPVVVAIHDVSFWAHPEWFPWKHGLRRRWLARWSARRAAAVLTLTEFSRREIVRWLRVDPARVHVVAPAVDSHPSLGGGPPAPQPARAPMVLYVGSLFNRRHLPALIAAFDAVLARVPTARLEIVGENRTHPPEDLHALVARRGLGHAVTIRDYVDEPTLDQLYATARAFAFLSEYEGFGLTPVEAMARGVPPVVLDVPVAREACGDGAIFVSRPDAVAGVRDALIALLTDDAHHADRVAAGRRVAAQYSWDRTARETFDVLAAVAR